MVGWYAPGYSVVTMEQIVEDGREMKILSSILLGDGEGSPRCHSMAQGLD
jgi:hypothetical protein